MGISLISKAVSSSDGSGSSTYNSVINGSNIKKYYSFKYKDIVIL